MAVNPLSRREVLKFGAYTTVGGVLTPGISLAQAIVTDSKSIIAKDDQIDSGGTKIPIYHAGPEKMAKYPVIVVISGFTGNSEQNKDVCRRFAHAGYYAIAPELYSREGGMQGKDFQQMGAISSKVTRAQYLGDIKAAADYARQQRWARAERIGVTGFCGGGALTLHVTSEISRRRRGGAVVRPRQAHVFRRARRGRVRHRRQDQGAAAGPLRRGRHRHPGRRRQGLRADAPVEGLHQRRDRAVPGRAARVLLGRTAAGVSQGQIGRASCRER